ncbi:MAG TPA: OmpH family outer membrane protein [Candidatus Acidoferrum sp.]|jgi:Skp family chaperone for outer membrane proteins
MRSLSAFLGVSLCAFVAAGLVFGQESARKPECGGKLGFVNLTNAIAETSDAKEAFSEMSARLAPRYAELSDINKHLDEVRKLLETGGGLSHREEQRKAQLDGEHLMRLLDLKNKAIEEDERAAKAEIDGRIRIRMTNMLMRYSQENGFTMMFDSSVANSPVIFGKSEVDLTELIVKLYDSAYPTKGAPGEARPAAPAEKP